jgi:hypothetical protein
MGLCSWDPNANLLVDALHFEQQVLHNLASDSHTQTPDRQSTNFFSITHTQSIAIQWHCA